MVRETSHGGKIAAPIDIRIEAGKAIDADAQEIVIKITTSASTSKLVLEAEPSGGLTAINQRTHWEVSGPPQLTQVVLPVRISGTGGMRRLLLAATITLPNGEEQSVIDTFLIHAAGDSIKAGSKGLLPDARLVKGPDGRLIQEVPARNR
jgi:hypothetical protein